MPCPGNIYSVVGLFKEAKKEVTNDQIISAAGGSLKEWGSYLKGAHVAAVVQAVNTKIVSENLEIVSEGWRTERWQVVDCSKARMLRATQQIKRADAHIRHAEENMWDIARDMRAPEDRRQNAIAWLELFNDHQNSENWLTFREWAIELGAKLEQPNLTVVPK